MVAAAVPGRKSKVTGGIGLCRSGSTQVNDRRQVLFLTERGSAASSCPARADRRRPEASGGIHPATAPRWSPWADDRAGGEPRSAGAAVAFDDEVSNKKFDSHDAVNRGPCPERLFRKGVVLYACTTDMTAGRGAVVARRPERASGSPRLTGAALVSMLALQRSGGRRRRESHGHCRVHADAKDRARPPSADQRDGDRRRNAASARLGAFLWRSESFMICAVILGRVEPRGVRQAA
jgi:hypothetical protein